MARQSTAQRTKPAAKRAGKAASAAKPAAGAPRVAVLGGGMGGLSAANQLLKAGFAVTLFEAHHVLGGNTSSETINGVDHDVYPHMFCEWYANFWHLFEHDLGRKRTDHFLAKPGVKMLKKGEKTYHDVMNPTSLEACIANLRSGMMTPAEMVLLGFSGLDLLAHPFDRSGLNQLQQLDVNGFIYSRGYSTEPIAKMENYVLSLIWSIQSEQTAAATYQNFNRHAWQFPNHAPFAWMLRGSLAEKLIDPIAAHLRTLGCDIRTGCAATALRIVGDRPRVYSKVAPVEGEDFDYVVCAVTAQQLSTLAMDADTTLPGQAIIAIEPGLAELRRLATTSIPVVDLYLDFKLRDFPSEVIGLAGSQYGLSALDISQLWTGGEFGGKTALVIAASEGLAIPSNHREELGWLMIKELSQFYPEIRPGTHWGDPKASIDWSRTHVRSNQHNTLFLNEVGSWAWRPAAAYPAKMPRVAFAGDLCLNEVDMATVEGAVITGISAARAIQLQDARFNGGQRRGKVIEALPHTVYSNASLRAAKLFFLPFAYAALGVVAFQEWRKHKDDDHYLKHGNRYPLLDYLTLVPLQYTIDWWKGAYWLLRSLTGSDNSAPGRDVHHHPADWIDGISGIHPNEQTYQPGQPKDREIGLGTAILMVLGECADYAISHLGKHPADRKTGPAKHFPDELADLAETLFGGLAGKTDHTHKRRTRTKR